MLAVLNVDGNFLWLWSNLSESVDVGSDGVGCTDQVQGAASPG